MFDTEHRPGNLLDTMSNQVNQFEIFLMNYFADLLPQTLQIIAGVAISAVVYPFSVVIFFTLVPIIMSVDYFENRAASASFLQSQADAKLMGKISSAIECRDSIRASNASEWVMDDFQEVFALTRNTHSVERRQVRRGRNIR